MWPGRQLQALRDLLDEALSTHRPRLKIVATVVAFVVYHVYLGFAINYDWDRSPDWCYGCRLLVVLTCITYVAVLYYKVVKPYYADTIAIKLKPVSEFVDEVYHQKVTQWVLAVLIPAALVTFYILDTSHNRQRLVSLSGIASILLLGFIFSKHPTQIVWRHVIWGLGIQFVMGLFILRWDLGRQIFECVANKVVTFLNFADAGNSFVFDFLSTGNISSVIVNPGPNTSFSTQQILQNVVIESIFAFKVLPVIMYFSFFISILYY